MQPFVPFQTQFLALVVDGSHKSQSWSFFAVVFYWQFRLEHESVLGFKNVKLKIQTKLENLNLNKIFIAVAVMLLPKSNVPLFA